MKKCKPLYVPQELHQQLRELAEQKQWLLTTAASQAVRYFLAVNSIKED